MISKSYKLCASVFASGPRYTNQGTLEQLNKRFNVLGIYNESEISDIRDRIIHKMQDIVGKEVDIMTQFGVIHTTIQPDRWLYSQLNNVLYRIIELGYDINDFDNILATVDLGIMVKNNCIYTNIEPDVLKWIYNNGFEDGLMQLASGYKSWLITFNPEEFMNKYLKLCKSYESKAALLGVRNRLMYDLLDGDTISINNGNKEYRMTIDTYKDTLLRYIRDKYETVNTMLESTLDDDLMTLEEIEQVSRFEKTRYDYNYDTKRKRIDSLYRKYGAQHHTYCGAKRRYNLYLVCYDFNIYPPKFISRLLNNVSIEDCIELGIQDYEKYNLGYVDNEEGGNESSRLFIHNIIRAKIKEEENCQVKGE
ncbi:MAG: hypothetical protein J6A59_13855 [Lachnospiraceae bacterium]|nr:hypothetical protein [Lachnospiraceae bacterium]